jgi:hypothetical protein
MSPATRRLEELERKAQIKQEKRAKLGLGGPTARPTRVSEEKYVVKINGDVHETGVTNKEADAIVQEQRKKDPGAKIDVLVDDGERQVINSTAASSFGVKMPMTRGEGANHTDVREALRTMSEIGATERHVLAEAGVSVHVSPRRSRKVPARYSPEDRTIYLRRGHQNHQQATLEAIGSAVHHALSTFEDQRTLQKGASLINSGAPIAAKPQEDPVRKDDHEYEDDRNGRILRRADHFAQSALNRLSGRRL